MEPNQSVTTRTGHDQCPECQHKVDSSTGDAVPMPGDLAVCFYCGALQVYSEDMALRLLTEEEISELHPETAAELFCVRDSIMQRRKASGDAQVRTIIDSFQSDPLL